MSRPFTLGDAVLLAPARPYPERAENAADRLRKISPEAGHLIHMPTHIYLRVGRYEEGAAENKKAMDVDQAYIDRWKVEGIYPMMYANHNIHHHTDCHPDE